MIVKELRLIGDFEVSQQVLNESDLKERLNIKQRAKLMRYLSALGIRFHTTPNGKIWTTLQAINETYF